MKKVHKLQFYKRLNVLKMRYVWRWKITASNGRRTGASTEDYFNRSECEQNAKDVADAIDNVFNHKMP